MTEFKLKGIYKETSKREFKKVLLWAAVAGAVVTKLFDAYGNYAAVRGSMVVAQIVDEAGVTNEVVEKANDYKK